MVCNRGLELTGLLSQLIEGRTHHLVDRGKWQLASLALERNHNNVRLGQLG
jgi:hypothetical protein